MGDKEVGGRGGEAASAANRLKDQNCCDDDGGDADGDRDVGECNAGDGLVMDATLEIKTRTALSLQMEQDLSAKRSEV